MESGLDLITAYLAGPVKVAADQAEIAADTATLATDQATQTSSTQALSSALQSGPLAKDPQPGDTTVTIFSVDTSGNIGTQTIPFASTVVPGAGTPPS